MTKDFPCLARIMRDVLIEKIYSRMSKNNKIFFLTADFGAPALDKLREKFKDRFINVGIAEQNLINLSAGLALEGFIVYAYGISAFLTLRDYEQIKVNLSLLSYAREINVNLIGVGAGLSYDLSGPTHQCIEDISVMRVLPNIILFSPSDWVLTEKFVDFSIDVKKPKYIRLDGKPLPKIYNEDQKINLGNGFYELIKGKKVCIVSTGYMTHKALKVSKEYFKNSIGVIDIFLLKPVNKDLLFNFLKKYEYIITLEEGFKNKGGLDCLISEVLDYRKKSTVKLKRMGFEDKYVFNLGGRDYLHKLSGLDEQSIVNVIKEFFDKKRGN